jgi:hypothetical protein
MVSKTVARLRPPQQLAVGNADGNLSVYFILTKLVFCGNGHSAINIYRNLVQLVEAVF